MQIFLSNQVESLKGSLGKGFGYHIEHRKNGFFSKRSQRAVVPPDGHWRFILACAKLTHTRLYLTDIDIHWTELSDALYEAGHFIASRKVRDNGLIATKTNYNANDIINLQITFNI